MIQKTILTLCLGTLCITTLAQSKKKKNAVPVVPVVQTLSTLDSASYSFGVKIAQSIKSEGVTSLNYSLLQKAMEAVFNGDSLLIKDELCGKTITSFMQNVSKAKFAAVEQEGIKFLEENKKNPNVVQLPSGLQYEIIKQTEGPKPKATDKVTVHYKGNLINGNPFDSSYARNEPLSIALNGVIPGWTEGVQLMSVGSKYKFYIPFQLGYGERGAGQDIPPYSPLIFEIELIKIGE
jgi:FKBP-type peptidyl-prolyl cis-trans isomerase